MSMPQLFWSVPLPILLVVLPILLQGTIPAGRERRRPRV